MGEESARGTRVNLFWQKNWPLEASRSRFFNLPEEIIGRRGETAPRGLYGAYTRFRLFRGITGKAGRG